MSWRIPTETDLLEAISGDELESLRTAVLSLGQADPIPGHLATVAEECRGYIAANPKNTLGPAGTVPPRLIRACVDIAILRVGSRAAGFLIDPEGIRRKNHDDAIRLFEKVAAGTFAVERPDEAADSTQQNTITDPVFRSRPRRFTHHTQDGI